MIKKVAVGAVVLLFFLFLHFQVSEITIKTYQQNLKNINTLLKESIELAKTSRETNSKLMQRLETLEKANKSLKKKIAEKDFLSDGTFIPIKERIKNIASMIDSLKVSPRRKAHLDSQLRAIYKELNDCLLYTSPSPRD